MTFWGRSLMAGVALVIGALCFKTIGTFMPPHETGRWMFAWTSGFAMFSCLLAGPVHTSDSISSEKREGTLGLLFLTDLRGVDIVLGKLASNSLAVIANILAVMPMLAVSLLMGGVLASEYWTMFLVLGATLLMSLGAGMLASALCVDSRQASALSLLLVFVASGFFPLLRAIVHWSDGFDMPMGAAENWVWTPERNWQSPVVGYFSALSFASLMERTRVLPAVGFTLSVASIYLGLASVVVPRTWQVKSTQKRVRGSRTLTGRAGQDPAVGVAPRRGVLDENPMAWLTRRHMRWWPFWGMVGLGMVVILGFLIFAYPDDFYILLLSVAIGFHALLKFWIASEATMRFREDRRSGAMELYLVTELGEKGIIEGQLEGLARVFSRPIVVALIFEFLVLLSCKETGKEYWIALALMVSRMVWLVFDAVALVYVGMWMGLVQKPRNAAGSTVMNVMVLPWVILLGGAILLGTILSPIAEVLAGMSLGWIDPFLIWAAVVIPINLFWITRASSMLRAHLREIAARVPGMGDESGKWWLLFGPGHGSGDNSPILQNHDTSPAKSRQD